MRWVANSIRRLEFRLNHAWWAHLRWVGLRLAPLVVALSMTSGCTPLEVKSTASLEAEQDITSNPSEPKLTAKLALECTWKGSPHR